MLIGNTENASKKIGRELDKMLPIASRIWESADFSA
jgi:hypothetical protein